MCISESGVSVWQFETGGGSWSQLRCGVVVTWRVLSPAKHRRARAVSAAVGCGGGSLRSATTSASGNNRPPTEAAPATATATAPAPAAAVWEGLVAAMVTVGDARMSRPLLRAGAMWLVTCVPGVLDIGDMCLFTSKTSVHCVKILIYRPLLGRLAFRKWIHKHTTCYSSFAGD